MRLNACWLPSGDRYSEQQNGAACLGERVVKVQEVAHADRGALSLLGVGGSDALAGRADRLACSPGAVRSRDWVSQKGQKRTRSGGLRLPHTIDGLMEVEDEVGTVRDLDAPIKIDARASQGLELLWESKYID